MTRAAAAAPRLLSDVVGHEHDPGLASRLHDLLGRGGVEHVHLAAADLDRRRLRATGDSGTEYAIVLPRDQELRDGAVLHLDATSAVVVRAGTRRVLTFRATDVPSALRLGFLAGHLHWKASFDGDTVEVTVEGAEHDYIHRLEDLLVAGTVAVVDGPA